MGKTHFENTIQLRLVLISHFNAIVMCAYIIYAKTIENSCNKSYYVHSTLVVLLKTYAFLLIILLTYILLRK